MIVKLKTKEQLKKEFGFEEDGVGRLKAKYEKYKWLITFTERKYLGTVIEVTPFIGIGDGSYTHTSKIKKRILGWHESWFEEYKFIDESEFNI